MQTLLVCNVIDNSKVQQSAIETALINNKIFYSPTEIRYSNREKYRITSQILKKEVVLHVQFYLDIGCFFTYFQARPCKWPFSEDGFFVVVCSFVKPLNIDLKILQA